MDKILVLMSTYNGEHYIKEQIDSILNQKGVDVCLIIRDDGSKDHTVDIVQTYTDERITLLAEKNIGCIPSFTALVNYANEKYSDIEFFAFADQDDYWMPDKLYRGVKAIRGVNREKPNLYFCNMALVDSNLNFVKNMRDCDLDIKRGNALLGGSAAGCTMVFNRAALSLYAHNNPTPQYAFHDYWLYLICVYMGSVVYDKNPGIKYRQHEFNVLGAHGLVSKKAKLKQTYAYWLCNKDDSDRQLSCSKNFLNTFSGVLSAEDKRIILSYIEYKSSIINKLKFMFNKEFSGVRVCDSTIKHRIKFAMRVILGKY